MNNISLRDWSEFVNKHPHGNIFQTPEFFSLNLHAKNYEPILISIHDRGRLSGILLAVIQKENFGVFSWFTSRSIIIGGPLVEDNNIFLLDKILAKYKATIKGRAIYTQLRNLFDWKDQKSVFKKYGFKYEPHLDILIDVNDIEGMHQNISKNKKRNVIKSKNKGTFFREIIDFNEFENAVKLINSNYKKIGLPSPSKEYLYSAFQELHKSNMLKVFGAFFGDAIIGTRIELLYKDLIYDWYAGCDENESNKYPNDFLIYNILLWGHSNNFRLFDFGGAGKPDEPYGVREHKIKFSNNLVEFGRFEYIHNRVLYNLGKKGLKTFKHINGLFK